MAPLATTLTALAVEVMIRTVLLAMTRTALAPALAVADGNDLSWTQTTSEDTYGIDYARTYG